MAKRTRKHGDDLVGASRLAVEATERVTEIVQEMHTTIAGGPALLGAPLAAPVGAATSLVYGSIRGVTRLVGKGVELALGTLTPLLGESTPGPERETFLAALNGVIGDHLAATNNPMAIEMRLRRAGEPLVLEKEALSGVFPDASRKVLVLVHGSSMSDLQWTRHGHDHGLALEPELGCTAVYVHYNSGLHVSTNGRALDALLERLVAAWPVDVGELVILGHSMGGLVARSACHYAEVRGDSRWRAALTKLVCLGTPHHGAPLERGGNLLQRLVGVSRYSAPLARLGKLRSAGVTDLRYGYVLDEHWSGRDRFAHHGDPRAEAALPAGVACYALAGSTSAEGSRRPAGDGLVPVASALGRHEDSRLTLDFPEPQRWVAYGCDHFDLLDRPAVFAKLREWLSAQ